MMRVTRSSLQNDVEAWTPGCRQRSGPCENGRFQLLSFLFVEDFETRSFAKTGSGRTNGKSINNPCVTRGVYSRIQKSRQMH